MSVIPTPNLPAELDIQKIEGPEAFAEDEAVLLVRRDSRAADAYLQEKGWTQRWREIDALYQNPRPNSVNEGSGTPEANVVSYTVAKHVNAIVPKCTSGLFYDDPPFLLRPRPGTDQDVIRAKTAVFGAQLDADNFEGTVEDAFFDCALFGTMILKWGWLSGTGKQKRYVRKQSAPQIDAGLGDPITLTTVESDELEVKEIEKRIERPHLEQCDLQNVKVDPSLRVPDIRKARWVIYEDYLTYNDLVKLRDVEGWNIPADEELKKYFAPGGEIAALPGTAQAAMINTSQVAHAQAPNLPATADPFEKPLLVQERWDKNKVIVVLNDKLCIRNEANPFGCIPFFSSIWWKMAKSFYGMGVGHLIGPDQRVQQGLRNAALNILAMAVLPSYLRSRGANVPTQQIRQRRGGIIDVDGDVDKAFKILEVPRVPAEVWAALNQSQQESESASGADSLLVQGSTGGGARTSMGRTAGGAAQLGSASDLRVQGPISRFINQVFRPWLYTMDELDKERLPLSVLRDMLGEELGPDFKVDAESYFNGVTEFEILAAARLAAKRGMMAVLPIMSQIFENPSILEHLASVGKTVDFAELIAMYCEVSEWRNKHDLVRPLNPEEKAHMQAMKEGPGAGKLQEKVALQQMKGEQQAGLQDQKNEARATDLVLRKALESTEIGEVMNGEPGNKGVLGTV